MTVGNLAALRQRHAVRLLAWSSVAQAGYILVPFAAGGSRRRRRARSRRYALMYALVNLGAFAVVSLLGVARRDRRSPTSRSGPPLAAARLALGFALLCLAGLPPGVVGLVAKVVVFQSAVDGDLTWLAVVMAVNVAIGLVYYLRFVVACVTRSDDARSTPGTSPSPRRQPCRRSSWRPWWPRSRCRSIPRPSSPSCPSRGTDRPPTCQHVSTPSPRARC